MQDFGYHRPASLQEALEKLKGAEDAKFLAGGQSLIPVMKLGLGDYSDLVSLANIPELKGVTVADGAVTIGAMTTHAAVGDSADVKASIPALCDLANGVGDAQVRNRGTMGGSVAHNDPAADYTAAVLGLNATIKTDRRAIAADDFFTGMFETALEEDELITHIAFPVPEAAAYVKFANQASKYAIVGVFLAKFADGVRVAITGAGEGVFRQADFEQALSANFDAAAIDGIAVSTDGLVGDMHAAPDYRAHLIKVMTRRAIAACQA